MLPRFISLERSCKDNFFTMVAMTALALTGLMMPPHMPLMGMMMCMFIL